MAFPFTLEERQRFLAWLRHGEELAIQLKGERARHGDVVWCLLVDALDMMSRLPDQERRWLTSGTRSGGWNAVGMTTAELRQIERIRIMSAIRPYDGATRYTPQRDDIDRAFGVLEWLRWLNAARRGDVLSDAAVVLATGNDQKAAEVYRPDRGGRDRQTTYEIKTRTTGHILAGLAKECGLMPFDRTSFVEAYET